MLRVELSKIPSVADIIFGEPKKKTKARRSSCPKSVKEALWKKYFGTKQTGKCYVCGKTITFFDFEAGHNKPRSRGGTWNINNLRPICRSCNLSMGTMSIETYKRRYFSKRKSKKKSTKRSRTKKRKSANLLDILI